MYFCKKALSILLAALLLLETFPTQAFAADGSLPPKEIPAAEEAENAVEDSGNGEPVAEEDAGELPEEDLLPSEDGEEPEIGFSLPEVLQAQADNASAPEEGGLFVSAAEIEGDLAVLRFCASGPALLEVTLLSEDCEDETVLASGKLEVEGTGEETEAAVGVTPADGTELPEFFILKATVSELNGQGEAVRESAAFYSTEHTRKEDGIENQGIEYFSWLPADHRWETGNGFIVYASTAVVISAEECALLDCREDGAQVRISPIPTEIREMTEEQRGEVTAVVFAVGSAPEHRVIRIAPGTLRVSEEENCLTAECLSPKSAGSSEEARAERAELLSGVYDSVRLFAPAPAPKGPQTIPVDEAEGSGTLKVTTDGAAQYNLDYYLIYWDEEFSYGLDCEIEYDLQLKKTTDFVPSAYDDARLREEFLSGCLTVEIPEAPVISLDITNFMIDLGRVELPNELSFRAASNRETAVSGVIRSEYSLLMIADYFFTYSSKATVNTEAAVFDMDTDSEETVFWVSDALETAFDSGKSSLRQQFEMSAESGVYVSAVRNDREYDDAENEKGVTVRDGRLHYCGTAPMPNNYCLSLSQKPYYIYDYSAKLGINMKGAGADDDLSAASSEYNYVSKAYDEHRYGTDASAKLDKCEHYGYRIDVTVFEKNGSPAAGAAVTAVGNEVHSREDRFRSAVTDSDGRAAIYVPSGIWNVQATDDAGGTIGSAYADVKDKPTEVFINDSCHYIERVKINMEVAQYVGDALPGPYDALVRTADSSASALNYSADDWRTSNGSPCPDYMTGVRKAIEGTQFWELTLEPTTHSTQGRTLFSSGLQADVFDNDNNLRKNCRVVYVKVSEDGLSARVMIRLDTYRKGDTLRSLTVLNGFGSGIYRPGDPVILASYDSAAFPEIPDGEIPDYLMQIILDTAPDGWTEEFSNWKVRQGQLVYPVDFTAYETGKYSLCGIIMADEDLTLEAEYKPLVDRIDIELPIPDSMGITLPQKGLYIESSTPCEAELLMQPVSWTDASGTSIVRSVYGDQYLSLQFSAFNELRDSLKFAEELDIRVSDSGSSSNKKFRLVGYALSEDKETVDVLVLVHVAKPGVTEYELTVNYGFLSGWYEPGTLVPIVSYDVPFLKDKLEDYLGKWATVLKVILPPSWQKSFSSWKVDAPTDGSLRYKDDFIPIVTKEGTTYAAAFFRMPAHDAELTAEYEGLTEIKEIVMDFDLPQPGSYMDYIASSSSEGVKSAVPYADKLGWYPMVWDTIFRADYNKSYTAFIPVSPKDGYAFGWPLGLTTKALVPDPSGKGSTEADFFVSAGDYALIVHSYRTPKARLLRVVDPDPIYFDNGTPSSEINEYLLSVTAGIVSEAGSDKVKVKWNSVADVGAGESGRFIYDSSLETRQEVLDGKDGTYTLKGTVILSSDVSNEESATRAAVDQTVEITVIIKAKDGEELLPPIAEPDSCESYSSIDVILKNPSANPSGASIRYRDAMGNPADYSTPINLPKRSRDTTYVIEAWTEHDGKSSPTVRFTYTIRADDRYRLTVNGGSIAGSDSSEAVLSSGTAVTLEAAAGKNFERFDHWEFEGLSGKPTDAEYAFTMPANDVTATAVFVPDSPDTTLIDKVALKMDEPVEGVTLAERVNDSSYNAVQSAYYIEADPQPEIEWNVEGYPEAVGGESYAAVIHLRIDQLFCGDDKLDEAYFSSALTATVNGRSAAVTLDQSRKYATVLVSFDVPKESHTVSFDVNGGDADSCPAPQTKQRGAALTLTSEEPVREGYAFLGWASRKDGGVEYAPGDLYEKDEDAVLDAVWDTVSGILKIEAAFAVPAQAGDPLPSKGQIALKVLDPDGAPIRLASAEWTDAFGLPVSEADTGDQYLTLTVREADPAYYLAEELSAAVKDSSSGGNGKVKVLSVDVDENGKEAEIVILVHIAKPGATEYYLTVDNGIGDGYYEAGDTAIVFSYDVKSISTVLKELFPEYGTFIKLAEYFAEKLTGSFERWEVIEPTDGSLEYKADFWPVVLKSGKMPKTTYAAAFFTMPAHDVELKAIYGSPETIDSVTMSFAVPKIGEKLSELAVCVDPEKGVKPVVLMGKDGKYKIVWSGPDKVGYNEEYTAKVFVTADSGYKLQEFLNVVTLDSYFPKGYDYDNGIQPNGYASGSCLGFMDYAVLSYSYKTPKAQLLQIEQPNTVYFANGTAPEEINRYLSELEIAFTSEEGQDKATANWGEVVDLASGKDGRYSYDSRLETRQEVLDSESGTYLVRGTLRLPGDVRNTQTKMHEKVDQTVEITVVILEKDSTELLPPTAVPDSCESDTELEVILVNDERNPEGTEIVYVLAENGSKSEETVFTDKILLPQRDEDTRYVIEARARKGTELSESVSFVYLVRAKEDVRYTVTVIGGSLEQNGTKLTEASFAPGEEVKLIAEPNGKRERFDRWEFEGLTGESKAAAYSFLMPNNDVTATAVFLPLSEDGLLIETAAITLEEPLAGQTLAESADDCLCTDNKNDSLTADPQPSVSWNTGDHEAAEEGKRYTASILLPVSDLRLDGKELPGESSFSSAFRASVNGKEARVFVDESGKFAVVEADFELPRTSFTVSYDANGTGVSNLPAAQTKLAGKPLTLSGTVPSRENYRFLGWSPEADAEYPAYDPGDAYEADADVTLYALWKREYSVRAASSYGGSADPAEQKVTEGGSAKISFTPLVQANSTWILDKVVLYDSDPADGQDVTGLLDGYLLTLKDVRSDLNVYAYWRELPHAVKAEIKAGAGTVNPETQDVETGGSAQFTLSPGEGYELDKILAVTYTDGERAETDVTDKLSGGVLTLTNVTQDLTAEIYFKELEFIVSYDANGGSGAPAAQTKRYHSALTLSDGVPQRDGWKFLGWSSDSAAAAAEFAPGSSYVKNESTTLYAVWTKIWLLTAECSEGGSADPERQEVVSGGSADVVFTPKKEDGVTWRLYSVTLFNEANPEGLDVTSRLRPETPPMKRPLLLLAGKAPLNSGSYVLTLTGIAGDVRLYAEFRPDPHNADAEIKAGKGTVDPEYQSVEHRGTAAFTLSPDVGYELDKILAVTYADGERTETDVTGKLSGSVLTLTDVTRDLTAEIYFKELEFTVSYDANGGSGAPAAQTKRYHSPLALSDGVPQRDGWKFLGWSSDSAADTAEYVPGGLYARNEDATLYAVWLRICTLTAECSEGGSADPGQQKVLSGESAEVVFTPKEEDGVTWKLYKVTLFSETDTAGSDVSDRLRPVTAEGNAGSVLTLDEIVEDVRLYAEFRADPHSVTAEVKRGQGTVSPEKAEVEHGGSVSFAIVPEEGWSISKVTVRFGSDKAETDLSSQVKNGTLPLEDVRKDARVEVVFRSKTAPQTGAILSFGALGPVCALCVLAKGVLTKRKKRAGKD